MCFFSFSVNVILVRVIVSACFAIVRVTVTVLYRVRVVLVSNSTFSIADLELLTASGAVADRVASQDRGVRHMPPPGGI